MFEWLESTSLALWVKESWGWPLALTMHAFGAATTVGLASIMSICMLGVFKGLAPASLLKLIPLVWLCLGMQTVSGFLLSLPIGPLDYLGNWWFDAKLALIAVALITTVYFKNTLRAEYGGRPSESVPHRRIPLVAMAPLTWIAASLPAAAIRYGTDYSGRYVFSYGSVWSLPLVLLILGVGVGLMYVLNKKT